MTVSPNKSLQRTANHKVLGRGRVVSAPRWAPRARVLTGQPAAAELSRWATLVLAPYAKSPFSLWRESHVTRP